MGNCNTNSKQTKLYPGLSANLKSKPAKPNMHITSHECHDTCKYKSIWDEFIIKLHHNQIQRGIANALSTASAVMDKRRLVFVSLIGLYQTWDLCPAALLYSSIFVLPLKRKWVYHQRKYKNEIKQSVVAQSSIFKDKLKFNQFLDLLKWKDSQNLMFWALDDYKDKKRDENSDPLTAAFWIHFNDKLSNLYDPIKGTNYKQIRVNADWWMCNYDPLIQSKYGAKSYQILMELYFVTMKFKIIQEIIYQSNPESLNPILSYNPYRNNVESKETNQISFVSAYTKNRISDYGGFVTFPNGCCPDIDTDNDDNDIWMISTEYNEYNSE